MNDQPELPHIDPVEKAMEAVRIASHGTKTAAWKKLRAERHEQLRRELGVKKNRKAA